MLRGRRAAFHLLMVSSAVTTPREHPGRSLLLGSAKVVVSLGLLALLLARANLAQLWGQVRRADVSWLAAALAVYLIMTLGGVWRWRLLLSAQGVRVSFRTLLTSYVVALFFNNFLPSNVGGDVYRIADTARPAGSKTLAATVVLVDRVLGLMALVLVASVGATLARLLARNLLPISPVWLWTAWGAAVVATAVVFLTPAGFTRILRPLTIIHPEWVGERIAGIEKALRRFRERLRAVGGCYLMAVFIQAAFVVYYAGVARALHVPIATWDLAVIVPLTFLLQLIPISLNGFGVREAAFSFFFTRLGLPLASALAVSLVGAGLMMLFSLSGALAYVTRGPVVAIAPAD